MHSLEHRVSPQTIPANRKFARDQHGRHPVGDPLKHVADRVARPPHRVLMALNMASIMAEDRDVLVYSGIQGIGVVLKDADDLSYSHFPSSKKQLATLPQKGVILMDCPGCLKAANKTAVDLAPGVQIADKDRFLSFTKGRILTLDY
jgi:predicted peroxiredoxin